MCISKCFFNKSQSERERESECLCVCVSMCVCLCVYVCVSLYICVSAEVYVQASACVYVCVFVCHFWSVPYHHDNMVLMLVPFLTFPHLGRIVNWLASPSASVSYEKKGVGGREKRGEGGGCVVG